MSTNIDKMHKLYHSTETLEFRAHRDLVILAVDMKIPVPLATLLEFIGRVP